MKCNEKEYLIQDDSDQTHKKSNEKITEDEKKHLEVMKKKYNLK